MLVSPRIRGTNTPLKIYSYLRSGRPIVATNLLTHTQVLTPDVAPAGRRRSAAAFAAAHRRRCSIDPTSATRRWRRPPPRWRTRKYSREVYLAAHGGGVRRAGWPDVERRRDAGARSAVQEPAAAR